MGARSPWTGMALALWVIPQSARIQGKVLDHDGTPAAAAEVYASTIRTQIPFGSDLLARGESDASGGFTLALPDEWVRRPGYKRLTLWAWLPDRTIAALVFEAAEIPVGKAVELKLRPPAGQTLEVLDADGHPVVGAHVAPFTLDLGAIHEQAPPELVERLAGRTNERGLVAIDAWPLAQVVGWRVEGDACGLQEIEDGGDESREWVRGSLKLAPVARVVVRAEIEGPGEIPSAGVRAQAYYFPDPTGNRPGMRFARGTLEGIVSSDRTVRGPIVTSHVGLETVRALIVASHMGLEVDCAPDSMLRPTFAPIRLEPGKEGEVVVRWKPGFLVKGRVVERGLGRPIPNARLTWFQYPCARLELVADADGRFLVHAFPGAAAIEEVSAPSPYLGVLEFNAFQYKLPEGEPEHELPDIELVRGTRFGGIVLDARGVPVPGAWVAAKWSTLVSRQFWDHTITTVADAQGGFVFDPVEDGAALEITARAGDESTSAPVKVAVAGPGPVEVKIGMRPLLSMRGRVVDERGRPVAGAEVEVWQASPENMIGGQKRIGAGVSATGPDGDFETPRELSPEKSYCVRVAAPGRVLQRTAWMQPSPERALEIALAPLAGIAGTLRAADGKPIAGARIFVHGDAPQPVESTTDEQGRFSLEGVLPGRILLLAEVDARLHGKVVDTGAGLVDWRLEANAVPLRALAPAAPRAVEREIARSLAEPRVQKAIEGGKPDEVYRALSNAAWAAPELALARVEEGALDLFRADIVRAQVSTALQADRPDDAEAVLGLAQGAYSRAWGCLRIAGALPEQERERKLALLAEGAARAQEVQDPAQRLTILTRVAELLFGLGEREVARKIVDRAAAIADTLPSEEWAGFARGRFAEVLARVDLDRALAIVDGLKDPFEHLSHRGNIAQKLAALDPEATERILSKRDRQEYQDLRWVPRVCHAMAPVDLERALRIAREISGPERCQALGAIALAIGGPDPAAARKVLDEAVPGLQAMFSRWARSDVPATVASLLPAMEAIDPSGVRELLWRAVSLRPPRPVRDELASEQEPFKADAQLALLVARYDRDLARTLLEPLLEQLKLGDPHRYSDWTTEALPAALAVTDPDWARSLAQTILPERAAATIAAVLGREGEERWRFVQDKYLNLWVVGKEDL